MANLNMLVPVGILFVVAAIALSLGADVLTSINSDQITNTASCGLNSTGGTGNTSEDFFRACGAGYNSSEYGLQGVSELGSWIPTIALVLAAAIIIGVVVRFLGR